MGDKLNAALHPNVPVGTRIPSTRPGFDEMWDGGRWVPICNVCGDEAAYCDGSYHKKGANDAHQTS